MATLQSMVAANPKEWQSSSLPFIINGLGKKATVPGGINNTQTNTLPSKQQASASQQQATGGPQNAATTSNLTKDASGNWYNPNSSLTPPGTQLGSTPAPQGNIYTTPSGAQVTGGGQTISTPQPITPTFPGTVGALLQNAQQTNPITAQALGTYDKIAQNIATLRGQGEAGQAGYLTGGMTLPVAQGRAQVLGQTEASQEQALGTQQQAALQEAGVGQAQQNIAQTGLNNAAGLVKPQLGSIGQVPYSPLTLNQSPMLGSTQPGGVSAAGNLLGQFQGAQAAGAAPGQAQASNTQALGTAPVSGPLSVYQTQLQNLGASQVAASQIAAFGNQLIATMSQPPADGGLGINPSSSQIANQTINQLKTQFSDPQYATFNTNIAGLQARVSSLLQTGEIPTAATAGAQAIVSGNANLAAMSATLNQIGQEAGAITGSQAQVASTAYQQARQAAGGGGFTEGTKSQDGSLIYKNGEWQKSQ